MDAITLINKKTEKELPAHCCGRCEFYQPSADFGGKKTCHKDTPKVVVIPMPNPLDPKAPPQFSFRAYFPPMDAEDWGCGAFSPLSKQ